MELPLIAAGLAMGIAASPHCAVMCGAPCAAMTRGGRPEAASFHVGRVVGYAAGGALAAGSMAALAHWAQAAPVLRPLWSLLQLGFLALGLWWLVTGRALPAMQRAGTLPSTVVTLHRQPWMAGLAGLAWVAWPCGALQAALLLAALASGPVSGALVMAAFALASTPALAAGPWAWRWWLRRQPAPRSVATQARAVALVHRVAGLGLVVGSGWSLTHGVWERFASWCAS